MKAAGQLITTFFLSIAQFIIGVMILADKASLKTIGVYYIVSSCVMVLVAIIGATALAVTNDKKN